MGAEGNGKAEILGELVTLRGRRMGLQRAPGDSSWERVNLGTALTFGNSSDFWEQHRSTDKGTRGGYAKNSKSLDTESKR